jgi:predicted Zn-dependent protease with MMP-like domain
MPSINPAYDEVLAQVSEIVNNIKSLIEEKQKDAVNEPLALAPVTDVLVLYNQMAQIYIEPSNTPQTT